MIVFNGLFELVIWSVCNKAVVRQLHENIKVGITILYQLSIYLLLFIPSSLAFAICYSMAQMIQFHFLSLSLFSWGEGLKCNNFQKNEILLNSDSSHYQLRYYILSALH